MMTEAQRRRNAAQFVKDWQGRGYEKGETQPFRLQLLHDVCGAERSQSLISFEKGVKPANASFIDAIIPSTHVPFEQKGRGHDAAVMKACGFAPGMPETEIVAALMERCSALTDGRGPTHAAAGSKADDGPAPRPQPAGIWSRRKRMAANSPGKHLPYSGVGMLIVLPQAAATAAGVALSRRGLLPALTLPALAPMLFAAGALLLAFASWMLWRAVARERIFRHIACNRLAVSGVYGMVRNPMYSCVLLSCTGVLLMHGNLLLLVIPPVCWAYMSVFLMLTEERWLLRLYGTEYAAYCKKVNRCLPRFPSAGIPDGAKQKR